MKLKEERMSVLCLSETKLYSWLGFESNFSGFGK